MICTGRRRGFVIVVAMLIVLTIGAMAASVVAIHAAAGQEQSASRAHAQATLAARGALELVRAQGVTGEVAFSDGRVFVSKKEISQGSCVTLDARFENSEGVAVRKLFEAVLAETPQGVKLTSWRELFAPVDTETLETSL